MQILGKYEKDYQTGLSLFREERKRFMKELADIRGIRVVPSQANFVMAELDESIITSGELVKLLLAEHNLLIKDLRGKTSRNYIRLAIRKPDENNILLEKLRMILG